MSGMIKIQIKRGDLSDSLKLMVVKAWLASDQVNQWRRKIVKRKINQGKLEPMDCFDRIPDEFLVAELQNFLRNYRAPVSLDD